MTSSRQSVFSILVFLLLLPAVGFSASAYPPGYRWKTITTENFLIHFHQGEEDLAARAAVIAEEVHARVVPLMDYEPKGRTHIILTDNVDVSNGSATPFPHNRIEVYVSAPGADPSSQLEFYDDWLGLVITHEYVHILHLDQAYGVSGVLRRFLGRTPLSFRNLFSPLWMTEGIATLIESEATDAGRLKGTFTDMVLRTAAVEKRWLNEAKAGGITPEWPGGSARYLYGAKFLSWIAQNEGMDKLAKYFHEYAGNILPYRVDSTAKDVFGSSIDQLYRAWSTEAQEDFLDEYRRLSAEGLTERTKVTELGYETKYSTISPDGRFIAYGHRGAFESPTLRIMDVQSGRDVHTRRVNTLSHLSWSPDSRSVAFAQLEFHKTFSLLSDIYVWDFTTGHTQRVTRGKRLKDPAFTPDGKTILAIENRAGLNRIVEVDPATGTIRPLVTPEGPVQFSGLTVSPDGSKIALAEWLNGRIDIVMYSRDGRRLGNLTETLPKSTNASPRFSTDGQTIFFSSNVTGVSNIFTVDGEGSDLRRVTNLYGGGFFPSTADGRTVYYNDYSAQGFDLARFTAAAEYEIRDRVEPSSVIRRGPDVPLSTSDSATASTDSAAQTIPPAVHEGRPEADSPRASSAPARPYNAWQTIRPQWWMPLFGTSGTETVVGAQTSGADVLGFHQYDAHVIQLWGEDLNETDFGIVYSYDRLYPTLTAAVLQFDTNPDAMVDGPAGHYLYRETVRRSLAQMTVPYRRYTWQTHGSLGFIRDSHDEHLPFEVTSEKLRSAGIFTGTLQGIRAGIGFDNTRQSGYSVSAENGILATVDYEDLSRSLGSDSDHRQVRSDLRGFLAIPYQRSPLGRHVLAARAAAGFSEGDYILQRELQVGGSGFGSLLRLDTSQFPVRGFGTGELRGQNAALASVEYRFPLWQIDRGPSRYPVFFNRLIGDVFIDAGTAWNDKAVNLPSIHRPVTEAFQDDTTLASTGAEIGLDFHFGYFIPLRYRLGGAYILRSPDQGDEGTVRFYLAAGTSF